MSDDLRVALERASGRPLGSFFARWLTRPGFPELTTSWRYAAARRRVALTVRQGSRFGPYALSLPIDLIDATGHAERVTVAIPAAATATLEVRLRQGALPPVRLVYDPDVALLATVTESP